MKCLTKSEHVVLKRIAELKRQYQAKPSPALKAEIKKLGAELHAAHAAAEAAMKQIAAS